MQQFKMYYSLRGILHGATWNDSNEFSVRGCNQASRAVLHAAQTHALCTSFLNDDSSSSSTEPHMSQGWQRRGSKVAYGRAVHLKVAFDIFGEVEPMLQQFAQAYVSTEENTKPHVYFYTYCNMSKHQLMQGTAYRRGIRLFSIDNIFGCVFSEHNKVLFLKSYEFTECKQQHSHDSSSSDEAAQHTAVFQVPRQQYELSHDTIVIHEASNIDAIVWLPMNTHHTTYYHEHNVQLLLK